MRLYKLETISKTDRDLSVIGHCQHSTPQLQMFMTVPRFASSKIMEVVTLSRAIQYG